MVKSRDICSVKCKFNKPFNNGTFGLNSGICTISIIAANKYLVTY